jgi:hypothetical protein
MNSRLIKSRHTPTSLTEANSAVRTLILQIRPYREKTDHWNTSFGEIGFEQEKREESAGRGRGYDMLELQSSQSTIQLNSLDDVAKAVTSEVVYARRGDRDDLQRYVVVLRPPELRDVLTVADDCLDDIGLLHSVEDTPNDDANVDDLDELLRLRGQDSPADRLPDRGR